jgi:parvulin-like peptidyl-prolyl isomerase
MLTSLIFSLIALQAPQKPAQPPIMTPKPLPTPPVSYKLPPKPAASKILATVNGIPITAGSIEDYLWDWKAEEVVENMISFEVVNSAAKKLKLSVTDKEVNDALEEQLNQIKGSLPPNSELWTALRQKGYPPTRLRLTIKNGLLLDKVVLNDFKLTDFVKISTIIVKSESTKPEDQAAALKKALGYYDQLVKKDSWTNVLAASTTDQSVLKSGGMLGWRAIGAFPPDAQAEIKALKPGAFSHPISTAYGVQIFRLEASAANADPADIKSLKQQYVNSRRQEVLNKLRDEAKISRVKG